MTRVVMTPTVLKAMEEVIVANNYKTYAIIFTPHGDKACTTHVFPGDVRNLARVVKEIDEAKGDINWIFNPARSVALRSHQFAAFIVNTVKFVDEESKVTTRSTVTQKFDLDKHSRVKRINKPNALATFVNKGK